MRSDKFQKLDELAAVLRRHLIAAKEKPDRPAGDMTGWAGYILAFRGRGSENFSQSESRAQISDLAKPIKQLLEIAGKLGKADRGSLQVGLMVYLEKTTGTRAMPKLADLEEQLRIFQKGIEWQAKHARFFVRPRRLARDATDWRRIATAQACCIVWGKNAKRLQTAAWRRHTQDLPVELTGPEAMYWGELDRLAAFAPKTINRDVPGQFGRFLQDVLIVLPDRDKNGEPYDAADTLRALRRVQQRKARRF